MYRFVSKVYNGYLKITLRKKVKCQSGTVISRSDLFEGHNFIGERTVFRNSAIGFGSYVSFNSRICNAQIGRFTCIADNVCIIAGRHPIKGFVSIHPAFYKPQNSTGLRFVENECYEEYSYIDNEGKYHVKIGNDVWIGSHAMIMDGVRIGNGAVIAAGSLVRENVPDYAIVAGVPARIIKYRFEQDEIEWLSSLQWWDKGEKWIEEHAKAFRSITSLKKKINA